MIDQLTEIDSKVAKATEIARNAEVPLRNAMLENREVLKANEANPDLPFPRIIVDLRRDRDDAHKALEQLRRKQVDRRRAVLASFRMDDRIDWNADPYGDGVADLVHLVARVVTAESASGMPPQDIARAEASMDSDISERLRGHQDRGVVISVRMGALHTRLRDALDYQAERAADARLRAKLAMPAG
jgi:hypothetical protein